MALPGDTIEAMRERTGSVSDSRALVQFLYILMRDHLTPGAVEDIMEKHVGANPTVFTNGHLARHAQDVASRLCSTPGSALLPPREERT